MDITVLFFLWLASIILTLIFGYFAYENGHKFTYNICHAYIWLNVLIPKIIWGLLKAIVIGVIGGLIFNRVTSGPIFSLPENKPYQNQGAPKLPNFDEK